MQGRASFFFRKQTKQWYIQFKDGKQQPLGKDKDEAERKFHALLASPVSDDPIVREFAESFLAWLKINRAPATYDYYEPHVIAFTSHVGRFCKVSTIRPVTLSNWADRTYRKSVSKRIAAYRSIIYLFNWCKKEAGLIRFSPVDGVKKPAASSREDHITPEQYQKGFVAR